MPRPGRAQERGGDAVCGALPACLRPAVRCLDTRTLLCLPGICGQCVGRKKCCRHCVQEFLDFIIAWESKDAAASISYLFTVYDLRKTGKLTGVEIYMFLMEIYKMVRQRPSHPCHCSLPLHDMTLTCCCSVAGSGWIWATTRSCPSGT